MNDNIKQCAAEAEFSIKDIHTNADNFSKFAELIVAHCTETVRDVLREENSTLSYENANKLQQRMKDFFGIAY